MNGHTTKFYDRLLCLGQEGGQLPFHQNLQVEQGLTSQMHKLVSCHLLSQLLILQEEPWQLYLWRFHNNYGVALLEELQGLDRLIF